GAGGRRAGRDPVRAHPRDHLSALATVRNRRTRMNRRIASLVVVASACLATASTAGATGAGQICPTFKQGKLTFHPETVGKAWTCASAKPWIVKLIGDPVHVGSRNVPLTNGPRGYHCLATPF